jgi:hypothetical protein
MQLYSKIEWKRYISSPTLQGTCDEDSIKRYGRWNDHLVAADLVIAITGMTLSNSDYEKELEALLEFSKPKVYYMHPLFQGDVG